METNEIVGLKIGRWTIIKYVGRSKKRENRREFLYRCECGKEKIKIFDGVNALRSNSCGCLWKEIQLKRITKHGMCRDRFYKLFHGIKARCLNKHDINYKNYGGRGIKLLWTSFEDFKKDMYRSYLSHVKKYGEKQTTIDRINNDGNYCKKNCQWSTYHIQLINKRKKLMIKYKNKLYSTRELSLITGESQKHIWKKFKDGKYEGIYPIINR